MYRAYLTFERDEWSSSINLQREGKVLRDERVEDNYNLINQFPERAHSRGLKSVHP
jgi:hypothetical protein